MITSNLPSTDFKASQLKYERVKTAYDQKGDQIKEFIEEKNIHIEQLNVYIRAFKKEGELEVWAKNKDDIRFQLIRTYKICHASGKVGPKRIQGDRQVPEGFYHIDRFNPMSKFHLSLGINYPNDSDKMLSDNKKPGGDIFIHGDCVSIGCLAMTDNVINEIYIMCVEARNNGQNIIPVTIYPFRMNKSRYDSLVNAYQPNESTKNLWSDLKIAFDLFEKNKSLPKITFLPKGRHKIS